MAGECKKVGFMKKEENSVYPETIVALYWGFYDTDTRVFTYRLYDIIPNILNQPAHSQLKMLIHDGPLQDAYPQPVTVSNHQKT